MLRKVPQSFIIENAMDITMMKMAIWLLMSQRQKCSININLHKSVIGIVKELNGWDQITERTLGLKITDVTLVTKSTSEMLGC